MQNHQHSGWVRTLGLGFVPRLLLAALLLGLSLPAVLFAQAGSGTIEGRVLNAGNNRYLNNARVIEGCRSAAQAEPTESDINAVR